MSAGYSLFNSSLWCFLWSHVVSSHTCADSPEYLRGTLCRSFNFYVQFSLWYTVCSGELQLPPSVQSLSSISSAQGTRLRVGFPSLHCNMEAINSLEAINGGSPDTWHLFSFFSGFTFYFLMICIFYSVLVVSYGRVNPYYSIWPEAKVIYLILFNILPVFLLFQLEQLQAELARSIGSWGLRLKPLHVQEIPEFLNMWLLIWIFEVMVLDFLFYEFSHA